MKLQVDTGYQGLQKKHLNTEIPKKRSKKNPLTEEDKKTINKYLQAELQSKILYVQ